MQPEIEKQEIFRIMDLVKELQSELIESREWPEFQSGDTINVTYKIKEGDKERLQSFQGVVIQRIVTNESVVEI